MKRSKRIITVLMSVSLLLTSLCVPNAIAQETEPTPTVFTTDFSSLPNGEISTLDTQTVNALQDKFIFYYEQEGYYFERPNVNGYLCLEDGTDTYGVVSNKSGTAYYMPDTGHSAGFTNFDGVNNDWNFPMYTIDGKWIYLNAHPCNYTYRHAGIMYPKATENITEFATLKDFSLEMDFKFRKFDSNHPQFMNSNCDTLSFLINQSLIGSIKTVNQTYFNIGIDGKATVGTGNGLTGTTVQLQKADGTNTKFVRNKEYHIKLTVLNGNVQYEITDTSNKNIAIGSFEAPVTQQGYLGISGSNEGVAMANIYITRFDNSGNAIDFYDEDNGYGLNVNFGKIAHYRYTAGNKDNSFKEKHYIRNPEGSKWLYTVKDYMFVPSDTEQPIIDYINDKFNLYYDYHWHNTFEKMENVFENTSKYNMDTVVIPNIQTYLQGGARLYFEYTKRCHAEWQYSNMISLSPKMEDGSDVLLQNFELEFTPENHWSTDPADGVAISFRSGIAGKGSGYADKVTLVVGQKGFALYDNVLPGNNPFKNGNYIPWKNDALVASPLINLRVVEDKLYIKATNGSDVLYEGTLELKKPSLTGYLYFSAANYLCGISTFAVKRLDSDGNAVAWETGGDSTIVDIYSGTEDITIDRSKNETLDLLPTLIVGMDASGNRYNVPVEWSCEEYRSYLNKDFTFRGKVASEIIKISDELEIKLTVKNRINGDFDTETSRKYYFDHGNDLLDFVCRKSSYDISNATSGYKEYLVSMEKVDAGNYYKISDGKVLSHYSKSVDGGWNGMSRLSDITSMLLEDPDMMLLNYKLEIDYRQPNGYYSYILSGVQDPSKTFGNLWLNNDNVEISNGQHTDVVINTATGGIYTYMEREGYFNNYGAIDTGIVRFEMDIPGYSFIKNYMNNLDSMHHMTITVIDGKFSIQVDDSAVYYSYVTDEAFGGYTGFGSQGQYCLFDNFQLTALNEFGEPMSIADAEKGFAPETPVDTYKGWNPTADQLEFVWGKDYID